MWQILQNVATLANIFERLFVFGKILNLVTIAIGKFSLFYWLKVIQIIKPSGHSASVPPPQWPCIIRIFHSCKYALKHCFKAPKLASEWLLRMTFLCSDRHEPLCTQNEVARKQQAASGTAKTAAPLNWKLTFHQKWLQKSGENFSTILPSIEMQHFTLANC